MAIGVLTEIDEGTLEQYDQVNERIQAQGDPPAGMIVHTAGAKEGGGFRIFDVWESQADFERFQQERLGPVVSEVVGADARPSRQEVYELHDLVRP
jgi:hypothetical protein